MKEPQTLLLAEFYTSTAYLSRTLFVYFDIENLHRTQEGKIIVEDIFQKMCGYFTRKNEKNDYEFNLQMFRQNIADVNAFIEHSLKNPFYSNLDIDRHLCYINLVYASAFSLHQMIISKTESDIALPQSILGEEMNKNFSEISQIKIDLNQIELCTQKSSKENSVVKFLHSKRLEKYQVHISSGHKNLALNNFSEAIKHFQLALSLNETAEVLNLIGWTHSLSGDLGKAKAYSYRAIEKDSQYGPALNDYGNYLFLEGKYKDSLKWFELAKRSLNYENREFAFINAGKAYMQLDMFKEALDEFSLALSFTPYNEDLHQAVSKIRDNLTNEITHERLS